MNMPSPVLDTTTDDHTKANGRPSERPRVVALVVGPAEASKLSEHYARRAANLRQYRCGRAVIRCSPTRVHRRRRVLTVSDSTRLARGAP